MSASSSIIDLDPSDEDCVSALVALSLASAAMHAPNWLPTERAAREEVEDACSTTDGRFTRVAVLPSREPQGWISCVNLYAGVWEIHPLLVAREHHGKRVGSRLVRDVEARLVELGATVVVLSTSDEVGATSLFDRDLYADPLKALMTMEVHRPHAVQFWTRMGYALVGVTPDAEGPGRPAIHFARTPRPLDAYS